MALSSQHLNKNGEFKCWVCGKKDKITNGGTSCNLCGHFVCPSCTTSDPSTGVDICKKCAR
jgi:phage/plasmid primase-like uncharacterized protein